MMYFYYFKKEDRLRYTFLDGVPVIKETPIPDLDIVLYLDENDRLIYLDLNNAKKRSKLKKEFKRIFGNTIKGT